MKRPDVVLHVAMTPKQALAMVSSAMDRRERRLLGLLKTRKEFIGRITPESFEVWERQHRAVHAIGEVRKERGGALIEVRFVIPPVTWALTVMLFIMYGLVTVGLASRPPDPTLTWTELATMVGGAVGIAAGFTYFARRQRADLREFVTRLFEGAPG